LDQKRGKKEKGLENVVFQSLLFFAQLLSFGGIMYRSLSEVNQQAQAQLMNVVEGMP
jgi:hypothetical protein